MATNFVYPSNGKSEVNWSRAKACVTKSTPIHWQWDSSNYNLNQVIDQVDDLLKSQR